MLHHGLVITPHRYIGILCLIRLISYPDSTRGCTVLTMRDLRTRLTRFRRKVGPLGYMGKALWDSVFELIRAFY